MSCCQWRQTDRLLTFGGEVVKQHFARLNMKPQGVANPVVKIPSGAAAIIPAAWITA
jgi:hypothetical protein